MQMEGRHIEIRGAVQGVGFRPWVYRIARDSGVHGWVRNDGQGVTIEAFGPVEAVETFMGRLQGPPPAARVREVVTQAIPARNGSGFAIVESGVAGLRRVSVPPDLPTCEACLAEVFDPRDRRYRYPFTNCTACGPRFTILRSVPYDRAATTMAPFTMCARCRREYESVADRRFHAEPNACPECGPRLRLLSPRGEALPATDAILAAAAYLQAGLIVAVKGLGGYHLACDATSSEAVSRLRQGKRRDEKPFAVMVRDLPAAARLAAIGPEEERLLASVERPIVLLPRRESSGLAPEVAPATPLVGVMLAYTPLHHLLLAAAGRPLVMTSGNLGGEPIVHRDDEARARLGAIADALLVHDREIAVRCDDSVARVVAGRPVVLRRARGYVPRPVPLARPVESPVLACGGHLKNAFCVAVGDAAYLGPHVGDLETLDSVEAFEQAVEHVCGLLRVRPDIVAHDLHPGYLSTAYALARPGSFKVGIQHHHAHVASALAEHGLGGPVIGVAYDGTGYGTDGALWGGEVLLADLEGFDRLATFRPLRLAGGDAAIRHVWRLALALLDDAYDGAPPPLDGFALFRGVPAAELEQVRAMLARPGLVHRAHGVGRYFDAFGALFLGRRRARHEGQVADEWNLAASPTDRESLPYVLDSTATPWSIDLRPAVREAVAALARGLQPSAISARFHNTLAAATTAVARAAAARHGRLPVVLSGGCFQNALLADRVREALVPEFTVHLHEQVPPGDGGIALGQALIADALTRAGTGGVACA
jgi:hydrogenase maturation protein HypF